MHNYLVTNIRSYRGGESSTDHILVIAPKKEKIDRAQRDIDLRKFKEEGIQQQYE